MVIGFSMYLFQCLHGDRVLHIPVSVFCMVIGFIVFATKYEEKGLDIGWSMGVAIAGCICTFVAGIMCVLQIMAR